MSSLLLPSSPYCVREHRFRSECSTHLQFTCARERSAPHRMRDTTNRTANEASQTRAINSSRTNYFTMHPSHSELTLLICCCVAQTNTRHIHTWTQRDAPSIWLETEWFHIVNRQTRRYTYAHKIEIQINQICKITNSNSSIPSPVAPAPSSFANLGCFVTVNKWHRLMLWASVESLRDASVCCRESSQ